MLGADQKDSNGSLSGSAPYASLAGASSQRVQSMPRRIRPTKTLNLTRSRERIAQARPGLFSRNRESAQGGLALIAAMEKKTPHTSIPFTAGRYKLPCKYLVSGEGKSAKAHVMFYGGIQFTTDREPWERFLRDLQGNAPLVYLHNNRAKGKGRSYLAVTLPDGKQKNLARVLFEEEAIGNHLRYHDKNPFNLTRENIAPIKRDTAMAQARAWGLM